jgi:hypothetical protein
MASALCTKNKLLYLKKIQGLLPIEWSRPDLALTGTCRYQDAARSQNQ